MLKTLMNVISGIFSKQTNPSGKEEILIKSQMIKLLKDHVVNSEKIEHHLETQFGETMGKFSNAPYLAELLEEGVEEFNERPYTLFIFGTGAERDHYMVATAGLSDDVVNPQEPLRFELLMALDKNIKIPSYEDSSALEDETFSWIGMMMQNLCAYPYRHHVSLGVGHTLANRGGGLPSNPNLTHILLDYPYFCDPEYGVMDSPLDPEQSPLIFLGVYPIYEQEYAFKVENGSEALADLLIGQNSGVFSPTRPCVVDVK